MAAKRRKAVHGGRKVSRSLGRSQFLDGRRQGTGTEAKKRGLKGKKDSRRNSGVFLAAGVFGFFFGLIRGAFFD